MPTFSAMLMFFAIFAMPPRHDAAMFYYAAAVFLLFAPRERSAVVCAAMRHISPRCSRLSFQLIFFFLIFPIAVRARRRCLLFSA